MQSGRWWSLALAIAAMLLLGAGKSAVQTAPPSPSVTTAPAVPAEAVTSATCALCHEAEAKSFARNPHSVLDTKGLASHAGASFGCVACHGDPTAHIAAGGSAGTMFSFTGAGPATARSQRCLTCHATDHPDFLASPHARAGVDCAACHSVHASSPDRAHLLKAASPLPLAGSGGAVAGRPRLVAETCAPCHGDVVSQFQFNRRHRLQEGILDCVSCHNPHSGESRTQLGGFKQQQCAQCHADKTGPFVFEHGSVIVEGCVACHDPHGAPARHQLKFQRVAELCLSCHTNMPGFHASFTLSTQCTNCHSSIHGSNLSPFFLQ